MASMVINAKKSTLAYGGGGTVSWSPSDPKNKKMYKQYSAVA